MIKNDIGESAKEGVSKLVELIEEYTENVEIPKVLHYGCKQEYLLERLKKKNNRYFVHGYNPDETIIGKIMSRMRKLPYKILFTTNEEHLHRKYHVIVLDSYISEVFSRDKEGLLAVQNLLKYLYNKLKDGGVIIIKDGIKMSTEKVDYKIYDKRMVDKYLDILRKDSIYSDFYKDITVGKNNIEGNRDCTLEFLIKCSGGLKNLRKKKHYLGNFLTTQQWIKFIESSGYSIKFLEELIEKNYYKKINRVAYVPEYMQEINTIYLVAKKEAS